MAFSKLDFSKVNLSYLKKISLRFLESALLLINVFLELFIKVGHFSVGWRFTGASYGTVKYAEPDSPFLWTIMCSGRVYHLRISYTLQIKTATLTEYISHLNDSFVFHTVKTEMTFTVGIHVL